MTFNAFEFRTVASIEMAWEGASRLGERLVALFGHRRVLMITDAGLVKTGLVGPVEESLKRAGLDVVLFDSVTADPPEEVVLACVKQGREAGAGIVLGLGGGSSLDVAKVAAICLGSDQPLEEMYGVERVRGTRLPLVLVPTTAGTGSEVTNVAVITRDGTTKMGVVAT